jgi:CMP-N-acetylneuraminic acid synthetase
MTIFHESMFAVVPAREYDAHLPGKNVLPINNTNLLVHKIRQLKNVFAPGDIHVSSESREYLRLATEEGVAADVRPIEFAGPEAIFGDFVCHVASTLSCEHILWASPTSPLIDENDFELAIELYFKILHQGYDSLITTNKLKRFLLDENGPLNFRFDIHERCTTKLPVLFEFVNGIVIAPRASMLRWRYNWGVLPYKLQLPPHKIVDICNEEEYSFASFLVSHSKSTGMP